jgi:predicted transcriptional regulator
MSESYFAGVSRRRSRLEVKISILKAISDGATRQTQIMHHSNLSWSFARTIIRDLERQGLISTAALKGKRNFILSERGKRALIAYTAVTVVLDNESAPKQDIKEWESTVENLSQLTRKN